MGGSWKLRAKVRGAAEADIACVGPPEFWDPDRAVDIKIGKVGLGCRITVDGQEWSFLYGVDLDDSIDLPDWVKTLSRIQPRERTDKRDIDALVVGPEQKSFTVEWAHQTVRVQNQGGYFRLSRRRTGRRHRRDRSRRPSPLPRQRHPKAQGSGRGHGHAHNLSGVGRHPAMSSARAAPPRPRPPRGAVGHRSDRVIPSRFSSPLLTAPRFR